MTAIEQLQVTMVELAKKFQAGEISLDDFMEDQARLSESIAKAKLDETRAMAHAVKAAKEAEAGARELVATEAAIVLEGCDPFFEATAVITVTPGDTGLLFGCKVNLCNNVLENIQAILDGAGYNDLAYKPAAEITYNSDGIFDIEFKVKAASSTPVSTSGRKTATWQRGDVGPVSLAVAFDTAMDNEAKDAMLELDRRIRTGDLAKGSYGNESWQIKKAAVKRHGWGEGEVRTRCVGIRLRRKNG